MEEDVCPSCGHGFLADPVAESASRKTSGLDIAKMNSGQKLLFGLAIAVGITIGMVVLLAIGGSIF
jgi:hypothetical protein